MSIVQTINFSQFCDAFQRAGRKENFTYEGLEVLFNYLEGYSDETGSTVDLDVIALCCEYSEDSIENIISSYNIDVSDADGDEDEIKEIVEKYLQNNTSVYGEVDGGFVYAVF